jgi:hypothetical protein
VGSKTYEGVRFSVYPRDHLPPHVHGTTQDVVVVIALLANGEVDLANRWDAVLPSNAKRSVVAKILRVAAKNVDELKALWEKTHGTR